MVKKRQFIVETETGRLFLFEPGKFTTWVTRLKTAGPGVLRKIGVPARVLAEQVQVGEKMQLLAGLEGTTVQRVTSPVVSITRAEDYPAGERCRALPGRRT